MVLTNPSRASNRTGITLTRFIPVGAWRQNSSTLAGRTHGFFPDETARRKCCRRQRPRQTDIHAVPCKSQGLDPHIENDRNEHSRTAALRSFHETMRNLCDWFPPTPCGELCHRSSSLHRISQCPWEPSSDLSSCLPGSVGLEVARRGECRELALVPRELFGSADPISHLCVTTPFRNENVPHRAGRVLRLRATGQDHSRSWIPP